MTRRVSRAIAAPASKRERSRPRGVAAGLRLVSDPLVVFVVLALGVLAFAAWRREPDPRVIVVPRAVVTELARRFAAERGRAAEPRELRAALEPWKLELALHRAALELELGRDDPRLLELLRQRLATDAKDPAARRELLARYRFVESTD